MQDSESMLASVAKLTRLHSLEELESNLIRAVKEFFAPLDVFLLTIDRGGDAHLIRRGDGEESAPEAIDSAFLQAAAKALHTAHGQKRLFHEQVEDLGELVAYPLIDSPPLRTGVIMLLPPGYSEAEEAAQTTVIDIFRNLGELLDGAQRDELTGLLNRKTFDDNMHRISARSLAQAQRRDEDDRRAGAYEVAQDGCHYHLAMVDIDKFKSINDTFGHLVGDEVIIAVANCIRDQIRDTDLIYRFGGEEFVIILTGVDRKGAYQVLERLRETMAATHFPRADRVTVSYGLAEVEPGVQAHQILDRADVALYFSKQNGRNQGHYYEALLAAQKIEPVLDPTGEVELF